jgi:hypothetical protein
MITKGEPDIVSSNDRAPFSSAIRRSEVRYTPMNTSPVKTLLELERGGFAHAQHPGTSEDDCATDIVLSEALNVGHLALVVPHRACATASTSRNGTPRLDRAVAALREAFKERTRERVPLDLGDAEQFERGSMDLDLDHSLGPLVPVSSPDTLRRLLAYLGAMPAQLREVDSCLQSHGQGNMRITLQPGRKNLLRVRE